MRGNVRTPPNVYHPPVPPSAWRSSRSRPIRKERKRTKSILIPSGGSRSVSPAPKRVSSVAASRVGQRARGRAYRESRGNSIRQEERPKSRSLGFARDDNPGGG